MSDRQKKDTYCTTIGITNKSNQQANQTKVEVGKVLQILQVKDEAQALNRSTSAPASSSTSTI